MACCLTRYRRPLARVQKTTTRSWWAWCLGVVVSDAIDGRDWHGVPEPGGLEAGAVSLLGALFLKDKILKHNNLYLQFALVFGV